MSKTARAYGKRLHPRQAAIALARTARERIPEKRFAAKVSSVANHATDGYVTCTAPVSEYAFRVQARDNVLLEANDYIWVFRQGAGRIRALANCAADARLYTSATSGAVDDTSTSQREVGGLRLKNTVGGAAADEACHADWARYDAV